MKKSDLAQKLLDDLRLRKQRLAAAGNAPFATSSSEAQEAFRQAYQGSRASYIQGSGRQSRSNHRDHKSLVIDERSKDIVPLHKAQSSECFNDLSMVLAFALENGGRLGKIKISNNPMAGKKVSPHHMRGQSIDLGEMSNDYLLDRSLPSTSHFPALSPLQIKEIAKGAHKLNQILQACSNGLNFDRYSIEIGKELLKGAIDLEESLRMLVKLQDASEHMATPRRKQIQLLEDEDIDDGETTSISQHRSIVKPRFSFDWSSRNHLKEAAKTSPLKQKLHLPSHNEASNIQKHTPIISNLVVHNRSTSYDLDSRAPTTFSSNKNKPSTPFNLVTVPSNTSNIDSKNKNKNKHLKSTCPKEEKGRIPNIIAKLMGIEELPLKLETKNIRVEKAIEHKQGTRESSKQKEQKNKKLGSTTTSSTIYRINEQMASIGDTIRTVVVGGKQNQEDLNNTKDVNSSMKNSQTQIIEIKQQLDLIQVNQIKQNKTTKQEALGKAEDLKSKEEKSTGKGDQTLDITQKSVFQFDSQKKKPQRHGKPQMNVVDTTSRFQLVKEQKNAKETIETQVVQHEPVNANESKQQLVCKKSELRDGKQEATEMEQNSKVKMHIKDARNSSRPTQSINLIKRPRQRSNTSATIKTSSTEIVNRGQLKNHDNCISEFDMTKVANGSSNEPRHANSKANREKIAPLIHPVVILKPVCKTKKREERGDKEVEALQSTSLPLKLQTPTLQEPKKKIDEAKESLVRIQLQNFNQQVQHKSTPLPSLNHGVNDVIEPIIRGDTQRQNITCAIINKASSIEHLTNFSPMEDQALKFDHKVILFKGPMDHNTNDHYNYSSQHQSILAVHESQLKQILVRSQRFVNAAEALFNLQIPADTLHACCHTLRDKDEKLVVDCGYEIMQRKARRKELAFHPSMEIHNMSVKVKCLNDLVKELSEDLDHLKISREVDGDDYDIASFLHKMLKRDIQNKNLDANCMWDLGWSDSKFAYLETDEVMRDLEKHVLNRLLDEIMKDLLNIKLERYTTPTPKLMRISLDFHPMKLT